MEGESSSRLYKLKFYCQICNKQLKDKDGFNCHLNSNYHKQNLEIVADNPQFYINNYSKEFETGFTDILKRNHSKHWVSANKVYQEYIGDKNSTHMNATKWTNLTGFIKHLEATGKIELQEEINDKDIKEVKIKFVDNTPQGIAEKSKVDKKKKEELYFEKLKERKIQEQMQRDKEFEKRKIELKQKNGKEKEKELLESQKKNIDFSKQQENNNKANEKIEISLNIAEKPKVNLKDKINLNIKKDKEKDLNLKGKIGKDEKDNNALKSIIDNFDREINKNKSEKRSFDIKLSEANDKNISNNEKLLNKKTFRENAEYEEILNIKSLNSKNIKNKKNIFSEENEEADKEKVAKDFFDKEDPWIQKNLIVRIKDANLAQGLYHDAKAFIIKVYDEYLAELKISDTEIILRVDQEFLEPVIPKVNSVVQILYGTNKGKVGILKEISEFSKSALIDVSTDNFDEIIYVDLDGICKVNYKKEDE